MSTVPKVSTAFSTILAALSKFATESYDATAYPPSAFISATTKSAGVAESPVQSTDPPRSLTTTFAPSSAIIVLRHGQYHGLHL